MIIRQASQDDLESLSRLADKTFRDTYGDLSEEEARAHAEDYFSVAELARHIDSKRSRIFVGEEDRLVGYTLLCENAPPLTLSEDPALECVRLYLDRTFQGQKLGERLIDTARAWATDRGYKVIWLQVWDQNDRAIRFYQRNGFNEVGVVPYTAVGSDDRVVVMERILDP